MPGLDIELITDTARALYIRALKVLPPDVKGALARAHGRETGPRAREILGTMLRNVDVAETRGLLVCQDTGTPVSADYTGVYPFTGVIRRVVVDVAPDRQPAPSPRPRD